MTERSFIEVLNWRRFQHYDPAKRTPPWIKNHTDLTSNDAYRALPMNTRAVLHGLWIEYAKGHGRLPNDTRDLSGRLGGRVTNAQLELLNHAGFIAFSASSPVASVSRARVEAEEEIDKPSAVREGTNEAGNANGQQPPDFLELLKGDELLRGMPE